MGRGLIERGPVEHHVGNGHQIVVQPSLASAHALPPGGDVLLVQDDCLLHAQDARNVQRAGAQVVLLSAADLSSAKADAGALIQGAHSLGRMELVGRDRV